MAEIKSSRDEIIRGLRNGLIVSCQALENEPLYSPDGGIMSRMAKAAVEGGAVGIRANGIRDIREIKATVSVPLIGIIKRDQPDTPIYITVSMEDVDRLVKAGADIVAVDGTHRLRPGGESSAAFIRRIREKYPELLIMADIAQFSEAMDCAGAGADFVGTTLSGYTPETEEVRSVNFELIRRLAAECPARVIAEGRIHTPEEAAECFACGAFAIVVGGAITRPLEITRRFVDGIQTYADQP